MFREKETHFYVEEFEKYGIKAVYSKKNAGNMSDYSNIEGQEEGKQGKSRNRLLSELNLENRTTVMSFQTHTNNIEVITENTPCFTFKDIDGFITKRKDVALFTFYADCLPIFVYDKDNEVIGVWHSGWPGTYKEIMKNSLELMKKIYGTSPENILMALGIGIRQENYEVGFELYDKFIRKFGKDSELILKSFKFNEKTGKYHFSNIIFNKITALDFGIKRENLIVSEENTWDKKFHSYRREGKNSGRAAAVISFK
ncbi:MAG: polyphenol oxidase family protein [Leptotrichiaceae bacterium]|nr:polyphenol oxidase family protein [Leptotrichiaceae bacterium]